MKWLYGILCLFFLVLFHEFGHFLAAKLFKVKVESFSFGFGPVLLHKNWKGTDWRLSAFPLGGYCGMKGEKELQNALETGTDLQAEPDSLFGVHPLKRALIGFAGPFFNFIFAVFAFAIINMAGYSYYTYSNKIILADEVIPGIHSAAKEAGLLTNDQIISINGKTISDFSEIISSVSANPDTDLKIKVLRNGETLTFSVHSDLDKETGTGKIGVSADTENLLQKESETYSFFPALFKGITDSLEIIQITFKSIGTLFKGAKLSNTVSGLVHTTDIMGTTIKEGFSAGVHTGIISMLELLAVISVSLFFMNLLPVPVLDGGLILFALIETLIKKRIPPKVQYYTQFIGIAFIGMLFILALSSDFIYYIGNLRGN